MIEISLPPNMFTPVVLVLTVGLRPARAGLAFLKLLNGSLLWVRVGSETLVCPSVVADARLKL